MSFLDFDAKDSSTHATRSPFLLNADSTAGPPKTPSQRKAEDALEEEALLAEFQKNPESAMRLAESYLRAASTSSPSSLSSNNHPHPMTEIAPVPGFVLQTATTKESSVFLGNKSTIFPIGTQVFINVCSSSQLPKPSVATEHEIQQAINAVEGATYQVPFQLSPPREYKDATSRSYLVIDACVHTDAYKRTEKDFDYKLYIMELAMEWAEEKCRLDLSRQFQLPDLKSKDELKKRSVILPKLPPTIQEVVDTTTTTATSSVASEPNVKPVVFSSSKITTIPSTSRIEDDAESRIEVPTSGETDIDLKSRLMPCPKGTLGIIVEVDLPNHKSIQDVTIDVVLPDKLVIHSSSQGQSIDQGKGYHCQVDLPNEPVDLDTIHAEFDKSSRVLRIYTSKRKRSQA
ncbi:PIH1 domain-containing protein 1 [Podila humilis]|nr:PIH1 domain-containing protein 1 [Podila humilis]